MYNGLNSRIKLAVAALGAAAGLAAIPAAATAVDPPFDPICNGRVTLGDSRPDGDVKYSFACSQDIKGYAVVSLTREVSAFDTEPIVLHMTSDDPAPGEAFSCNGRIPGEGVGCGGSASAGNRVFGSVSLSSDPCKGKRPAFALVVSDAKGALSSTFRFANARPGPANRPIEGCPARVAIKRRATTRRTVRHRR